MDEVYKRSNYKIKPFLEVDPYFTAVSVVGRIEDMHKLEKILSLSHDSFHNAIREFRPFTVVDLEKLYAYPKCWKDADFKDLIKGLLSNSFIDS